VGAGDIDGDNVAEIIWRDVSGRVRVTLMNPDWTVKSHGTPFQLGSDYKFAGIMRSPGKLGHGRFTLQIPRRGSNRHRGKRVNSARGCGGAGHTRAVLYRVV
jgi:hypothetical protein